MFSFLFFLFLARLQKWENNFVKAEFKYSCLFKSTSNTPFHIFLEIEFLIIVQRMSFDFCLTVFETILGLD